MKITLDIKESQFDTFLAFIKTLDYVSLPKDEISIPQWQKEEVNRRLENLKSYPENSIDFGQMLNDIEEKYDL